MEAPELSLREKVADMNPEAIFWDGLDDAIIGISIDNRTVYGLNKMILLFQEQGMSEEEAMEWIDFNIISAYVGEYTPIHIWEF
jgi:hypothetical protein